MKNLKFLIVVTLLSLFFASCDKEITSVTIKSVTYTQFAEGYDGGDTFIVFGQKYNVWINDIITTVFQSVEKTGVPVTFEIDLLVTDFYKDYHIIIGDENNVFISGFSFKAATYLLTHPTSIDITTIWAMGSMELEWK
jgi:hypothetical protein